MEIYNYNKTANYNTVPLGGKQNGTVFGGSVLEHRKIGGKKERMVGRYSGGHGIQVTGFGQFYCIYYYILKYLDVWLIQ